MTTVALLLVWAVAVLRAGTGLLFLAAPDRPAEAWVGASETATRYLVRAIGGRDLAIGLGLVWALVTDTAPLAWLVASIAADFVDAASASTLGDPYRRKTMLIAGGFGVLGLVAAALLVAA